MMACINGKSFARQCHGAVGELLAKSWPPTWPPNCSFIFEAYANDALARLCTDHIHTVPALPQPTVKVKTMTIIY
jgi:hypothetical protein